MESTERLNNGASMKNKLSLKRAKNQEDGKSISSSGYVELAKQQASLIANSSPVQSHKSKLSLNKRKKSVGKIKENTKKLKLDIPKAQAAVKINLGENKQYEFNDYARSIKASPSTPYKPDSTPLSSVLKATDSPILVKQTVRKSLRSIPSSSKWEKRVLSDQSSKAATPKKPTKKKSPSKSLQMRMQKSAASHISLESRSLATRAVASPSKLKGKEANTLITKKSIRAVASDFF